MNWIVSECRSNKGWEKRLLDLQYPTASQTTPGVDWEAPVAPLTHLHKIDSGGIVSGAEPV